MIEKEFKTTLSLGELEEFFLKVFGKIQPRLLPKDLDVEKISQADAAKYFGVAQLTLIRWRKNGKIPFHRVAGTRKIFYLKSELILAAQNNQTLLKN